MDGLLLNKKMFGSIVLLKAVTRGYLSRVFKNLLLAALGVSLAQLKPLLIFSIT